MPERLDMLAEHENPVVRVLHGVFTEEMQQDPELKEEVWDELFGPAMDGNPEKLATHIVVVAAEIGKIATKGSAPNLAALARGHAEVRTLPDGSRGRMTERQFDLTFGAIATALDNANLGAAVDEVALKLPAIKAAIVEGIVPDAPAA